MNRKTMYSLGVCFVLLGMLAACAAPAPTPTPVPPTKPPAVPTAVPPTAVPPTAAPSPTAVPTKPPVPTATSTPKPLQKVTIAVGTSIMNVTYPWLMMPLALGYWKDEGYDVQVLPVGGSLQAVQQLVGGQADFVQINSSVVIQSNVKENIPLRVVMDNGVIDWGLVVLEDSPIKDPKEFKGKSIGVFNLASGGIPYMQAYLRTNGLNPDADIQMIAVGYGAPALDALKTGKVQGLMLWAAALAGLENQGAKFRYFRAADWKQIPDFALVTSQKTIDKDPAMVEAIARGAAKATVFALASPDCVIKVHWSKWPDTKPTGADDATLFKWDRHSLDLQLDTLKWAYELHGSKYWGTATAPEYTRLQDFLFDVKLIDKKLDVNTYLMTIPSFYEKISKFDEAAIKAQAANCPVK